MKNRKIRKMRIMGWVLVISLLFPCLFASADTTCWYFAANGTHDFEQIDVVLAGCETDGYYLIECRQCGYTEKYTTGKASGHSWEMVESIGSTCDTEGYEKYECKNCGEISTKTFPKLQHNWIDGETLEIATCTSEGCVRTYCTLCHINSNRKTAKLPHMYSNWSISLQPTDHSQGTRTKTCSVCGDTVSESFYPDGTLYRGMNKDDKVVNCQEMLIKLGFLNDIADGIFGKKTEQAVKDFQNATGFEITGVAYPQTLAALAEQVKRTTTLTETPTVSTEPIVSVFDHCTRDSDESGVNHISYCLHHAGIIAKYEELLRLAETNADKLTVLDECIAEWQTELESLYDDWFNGASDDDKPKIAQAKTMFLLYLQNQESMWSMSYSGQPVITKQHIINSLTEQCVDLCALAPVCSTITSFSFSHSGTMVEQSYTYYILQTEQGYLANYSLYYDHINLSFLIDEEDAIILSSIAKDLALWNEFHETNPYLLDGENFSLQIIYGNGSVISASGNNSFPDGYRDIRPVIEDYFLKLLEKYKISIDE